MGKEGHHSSRRAPCQVWPGSEDFNRGHCCTLMKRLRQKSGRSVRGTGLPGEVAGWHTCSAQGQPTAHQAAFQGPSTAAQSWGSPSTGGWRTARGTMKQCRPETRRFSL